MPASRRLHESLPAHFEPLRDAVALALGASLVAGAFAATRADAQAPAPTPTPRRPAPPATPVTPPPAATTPGAPAAAPPAAAAPRPFKDVDQGREGDHGLLHALDRRTTRSGSRSRPTSSTSRSSSRPCTPTAWARRFIYRRPHGRAAHGLLPQGRQPDAADRARTTASAPSRRHAARRAR